jgi:hypothetical protein
MSMLVQAIMFFELYWIIRNPFNTAKRRIIFFYSIIFLSFIFLSAVLINDLITNGASSVLYDNSLNYYTYILRVFIFLVLTIYVFVLATIKRLCSKGTSPELRKLVARRHLVYISIYTLRII